MAWQAIRPAWLMAAVIGCVAAGGVVRAQADGVDAVGTAVSAATDRIRITLDVQGEAFAPTGRDAPPVRFPIALEARFDLREAPVPGGGVQRRYVDAAADVRVDGAARRVTLSAHARIVAVVLRGTTPSPYLVDGFLTREELDLLETPFDPLLLDALRPPATVAVGDTWDVAADVVAGLLAIDTVESGDITGTFGGIVDGRATMKLSGIVDGAADGVPTHVTVEGSFTVPVAHHDAAEPIALDGRVSHLAVTLMERREASHVAPGFDVEARLAIARTADSAAQDTDAPAAVAGDRSAASLRRPGPGRPGVVWLRDAAGRYDIVHDERWRVIEDGSDGLVMRFVSRGALVSQCSITALPRAPALSPPSIAEVERDVERSLGTQFGMVEKSSEATRSDGVRIVRVATAGRADGLPFRWIHHVLTDSAGHRIAVTCMLETSMEGRFGTADRDLVDGISLPAAADDPPPETAGTEDSPPDREARVPTESLTP